MIRSKARLQYKVFTSFAVAALALIALVRFASTQTLTAQAFIVYATLAILAGAGIWRGVLFLRAVRSMPGQG